MNIAIAGLGTVGAEVARQLLDHTSMMTARAGGAFKIVAVSARDKTRSRGFSMDGIDFEDDPAELARRDDVDLVVELIGGDEGAAFDLVVAALSAGKSVVTANKALLAKHGAMLAVLAEEKGVSLAGEAAVAGGIPALKMLREGLAANRISRISGILNGTCNYILSTMEATGRGFDDVLGEAQELGYAEADPSFDIDGIDAAHKLALLAAIGFGTKPDFSNIAISGIRSVSAVDISFAAQLGYAIRLLATAEDHGGRVISTVRPTLVPLASSLAKVDGALNAVEVRGEPVGGVIAIGPGAGAGATASAVLADLIDIAVGPAALFFGRPAAHLADPQEAPQEEPREDLSADSPDDYMSCYYLRLTVVDRPGVLAEVTAVLSSYEASVNLMIQQEARDTELVEIVLTTHEVTAANMTAAKRDIEALDAVAETPTAMIIAAVS
jgi:homoserine dehydrogenase